MLSTRTICMDGISEPEWMGGQYPSSMRQGGTLLKELHDAKSWLLNKGILTSAISTTDQRISKGRSKEDYHLTAYRCTQQTRELMLLQFSNSDGPFKHARGNPGE
jgi:hypothetical protein